MASVEYQSFISAGLSVSVEMHADDGAPAPQPAVIMLHGADGPNANARYRLGARDLAAAGFRVFLVHYFDRTGERRASFGTAFRNFPLWLGTVGDALTFVAGRPDVDRDRIGVVGISLGAALGLALASKDGRIKALVDYFGPFPHGAVQPGAKLPPTLILHGEADPVVPVANAYAIEALLAGQGASVESKIYPGQGHGLSGPAERDATERVVAFLRRHLLGEDRVGTTPLSAVG